MGVSGPGLDRAVKDLEQQLSKMQPEAGTAVALHPQGNRPWLQEHLALPLLERAVAMLDAALADAPELRFNEALTHYRRGEIKSAGAALNRAHRHTPRVARFLLPAHARRVGVGHEGAGARGCRGQQARSIIWFKVAHAAGRWSRRSSASTSLCGRRWRPTANC
jgi:tetratricopeptide (TPR) repeat protein